MDPFASYVARNERRARLRAMAFPKQRAFIDDMARLKASICTRRAGKSYGIGIEICETLEQHPGDTSLYIGLTRETSKRIMCKDILARINDACGIGLVENKSELSFTHPNGAVIYLLGADASEKEKAKVLGQKYRRVFVDEAQSFRVDLRELVYQKLKPAVADLRGCISLHGTPGDFLGPKFAPDGKRSGRHLFFAVTKEPDQYADEPLEGGWAVHRWGALDNPHMRVQFLEEIAEIERDRPYFKDTPEYTRDYLGRWAIDATRLCYHYSAHNRIAALPESADWTYVIGVDLGFNDATAVVVGAYRPHDPVLYIVSAARQSGLDITDAAAWVKRERDAHGGCSVIVDGASKQGVVEMRRRHALPMQAAEKTGKADYIRQMSSDLQQRKILVVESACQPLVEEWGALVWDQRSTVQREDPSCENHDSDAALYLWRHARPYLAEPKKAPKPHQDSAEWAEQVWQREQARHEAIEAGVDPDDYDEAAGYG